MNKKSIATKTAKVPIKLAPRPTGEPTDEEIDAVLNECSERFNDGDSKYPSMSYEQGVDAAIQWMQGDGPNPFADY